MDEVTYYSACTLGVSIFMGIGVKIAFDDILYLSQPTNALQSSNSNELSNSLIYDEDKNELYYQGELLLKINNGSINHRFFKYLFKHQDKKIQISLLYQKLGLPENTYINKLIANTKLPKDIRCKAFLIENNAIQFKTHIN